PMSGVNAAAVPRVYQQPPSPPSHNINERDPDSLSNESSLTGPAMRPVAGGFLKMLKNKRSPTESRDFTLSNAPPNLLNPGSNTAHGGSTVMKKGKRDDTNSNNQARVPNQGIKAGFMIMHKNKRDALNAPIPPHGGAMAMKKNKRGLISVADAPGIPLDPVGNGGLGGAIVMKKNKRETSGGLAHRDDDASDNDAWGDDTDDADVDLQKRGGGGGDAPPPVTSQAPPPPPVTSQAPPPPPETSQAPPPPPSETPSPPPQFLLSYLRQM
ncbi:hypothetical protein HDU98_004919, partial [Podochytrium sp. JEL0797]